MVIEILSPFQLCLHSQKEDVFPTFHNEATVKKRNRQSNSFNF
jgi:hypothetical protein